MICKKIVLLLLIAIFSTKATDKTQKNFINSCMQAKDSQVLKEVFAKVPQEKNDTG